MKTMTHLPGRRAMATPARVPRIVEMTAAMAPVWMETMTAERIAGRSTIARNGVNPNSVKDTSRRPSLNEYTMMTTIGRNRNAKTSSEPQERSR